MLPDPHPLTHKDLFGTDDHWVEKLQKLFWDSLGANGWSPPVESVEAKIEEAVVRFHELFNFNFNFNFYFNYHPNLGNY